jgi:hypothetical protein
MKIATFLADSRWEMLFRLLGQPLLKGYKTAAGKCPKANGKPLGNSYKGIGGKCPNAAIRQQERRQTCQAAIGKNVSISACFLKIAAFLFIQVSIKSQSHIEKLKKRSAAPLLIFSVTSYRFS